MYYRKCDYNLKDGEAKYKWQRQAILRMHHPYSTMHGFKNKASTHFDNGNLHN